MKNIIFDIGNVLLEFKPFEFLLKHYDKKTMEDLMVIIFSSDEWIEMDLGTMSVEEVKARFIDRNPHYEKEIHYVLDHWSEMLTPIEDNVQFVKVLKEKGYRLYLLSNFPIVAFKEVFNKYDFFRYFDGMIISAYEHVIKPDERIYNLLLDRYHLNPGECLFIDDMEANVLAAESLGIKTICLSYKVNLEEKLKAAGIL